MVQLESLLGMLVNSCSCDTTQIIVGVVHSIGDSRTKLDAVRREMLRLPAKYYACAVAMKRVRSAQGL